jgi:hypothetical protein
MKGRKNKMKYFNEQEIIEYKKTLGHKAYFCDNTQEKHLRAMNDRAEAESAKGSTSCKFGVDLKDCEIVTRHILKLEGNNSARQFHVERSSRSDIIAKGNKHIEVKGGGNFGHFPDNWEATDIYPNAKLVAFCLAKEIGEQDDLLEGLLDYTAMLPRALFIDLLEKASRKGIHSTLHLTSAKRNGGMPVLAFQPNPLERMRDMVRDLLDHCEVDTLRTYLELQSEQ